MREPIPSSRNPVKFQRDELHNGSGSKSNFAFTQPANAYVASEPESQVQKADEADLLSSYHGARDLVGTDHIL